MFDGSAEMPDLHWIWAKHAYFINFSRRLHERIRRLGPKSLYLKYFVAPVAENALPSFRDGLRVFLWQRRPEEGINLDAIERLFGSQLTNVHIHDAADNAELDTRPYLRPTQNGYQLTVSKWFDKQGDYKETLSKSNVFIAPRRAEGIGLSFIEAMADGMLVVACDYPTHDEYVANWVNGVLFNPENVGYTNFDHAEQLARFGWQTARDGHRRWLESLPKLFAFLQATPVPPYFDGIDPGQLAEGLVRAYLGGVATYRRYLLTHATVVASMSGVDLSERLTADGMISCRPERPRQSPFSVTTTSPFLAQNRLDFAWESPLQYRLSGKLDIRDGIGWLSGHSASFGFRLNLALGAPQKLRLQLALQPRQGADSCAIQLFVAFNGWTAGVIKLSPGSQTYGLDLSPLSLLVDNVLSFQLADENGGPPQDGGAVGVKSWAFE
jgi:hypothetical protein